MAWLLQNTPGVTAVRCPTSQGARTALRQLPAAMALVLMAASLVSWQSVLAFTEFQHCQHSFAGYHLQSSHLGIAPEPRLFARGA